MFHTFLSEAKASLRKVISRWRTSVQQQRVSSEFLYEVTFRQERGDSVCTVVDVKAESPEKALAVAQHTFTALLGFSDAKVYKFAQVRRYMENNVEWEGPIIWAN